MSLYETMRALDTERTTNSNLAKSMDERFASLIAQNDAMRSQAAAFIEQLTAQFVAFNKARETCAEEFRVRDAALVLIIEGEDDNVSANA
jgi:hypothetical protein